MNPENPRQSPVVTAEAAATAYIAEQLPKARKALKRTRVLGLLLILFVGAYISVISVTMVGFFQPRAAAEVASGMLIGQLTSKGPALVGQMEKEIPSLIRQVPDYLIQEVPRYRQEMERALVTELQGHSRALSKEVGDQMDVLIDKHESEMKALLTNPKDRASLRKIVPDLDQIVTQFLATDTDGRKIRQQITDLAAELQEIEQRLDRLANGSSLTPEEQRARHSLAVLARAIRNKATEPETTPSKKLVQK